MSKNYVAMSQSVFNGKAVDVDGLIAQLEELCPEAVETIASIDWPALHGSFAKQALKDVAESLGLQLLATYPNTVQGQKGITHAPDGGTTLGVLSNGKGICLGVSQNAKGALSTFENEYSTYHGYDQTSEWKQELQHRYRELGIQAMLTLVGESLETVQSKDSTTFVAALPQKVGA